MRIFDVINILQTDKASLAEIGGGFFIVFCLVLVIKTTLIDFVKNI